MMALLLGIDLETTGLDPQKDKIIEVGWTLFDSNGYKCLRAKSSLVYLGLQLSKEIEALTGITSEMLDSSGVELSTAFSCPSFDYFVAHNASFEKSFLKANGYKLYQFPKLEASIKLIGV